MTGVGKCWRCREIIRMKAARLKRTASQLQEPQDEYEAYGSLQWITGD
jgi:hypothetical protein